MYKFDSDVLKKGDNIILHGYWNNYKYSEDIRDILLEEFAPKEAADEQNQHFLKKIQSHDSISIHFRRGDYTSTDFHGVMSRAYYDKAIEIASRELANPFLFIFSDEPDWILHNMKFEFPHDIIDFNKDDNSYRDIELMKNCKHNIIANSGFSWWGAWLNTNPDKRVVAPKNWISDPNLSTDDLIPPDWIRI